MDTIFPLEGGSHLVSAPWHPYKRHVNQKLVKTDFHCTQDVVDPWQAFSLALPSSKQVCEWPVLDVRFFA